MTAIVTVAAGEPWELALLQQVQAERDLTLARRCVDVPDLLAVAAAHEIHVAVISLEVAGLDTDTVYRLHQHKVVVIAVVDGQSDRRARALGIDATIHPRDLTGLAAFLTNLAVPVETSNYHLDDEVGDIHNGTVVAVWGPAGAPGRSTVALNLAAEFAFRRQRTLLIDADPYGGAIAQMLGILDEVSGLLAAARAANSGSLPSLTDYVYGVGQQLSVLTGLPRASQWSQLRSGAIEVVFARAREQAAVVVIDCGFSLESAGAVDGAAALRNQLTQQALDHADVIVVVGAPDPVGLTRLTRGFLELEELLPGADLRIVINRHRPQMGWSSEQIASTLRRLTGAEPVAFLPLEQGAIDHALMAGQSIREAVPDSPLTRSFGKLADQLGGSVLERSA